MLNRYKDYKLGESLSSWTYKPNKNDKATGYAIGILSALLILFLLYGHHILPWLKNIGTALQGVVILLLTPLFTSLARLYKERTYTLFKNGLTIRYKDSKESDKGKVILWKDFDGCTYSEKGVKLHPRSWLDRPLFLHCTHNRMEVYSLSRERIDAFRFGFQRIGEKQQTTARTLPTTPKSKTSWGWDQER